jgi:RNA polymerase sigma-70 factor (ECF subfamily)
MDEQGRTPTQAQLAETGERIAGLVTAAVDGDSTAFDALVREFERRAVAVASRLLGNLEDGVDVSQEAFIRAHRSLHTLEQPARFGAWLMRIVSNLALNYRRSRKRSAALSLDDMMADGSDGEPANPAGRSDSQPLEGALAGELKGRIEAAIAELPEKQRMALVLFAMEGMPQKEVAEVMECSVELVKWNVFQARKTLKARLKEYL